MGEITQKIDRLTNSIVNRLSQDRFDTDVLPFSNQELVSLRKNWKFNWAKEFKEAKVYKLVIRVSPDIIQALMSLEEQKGFIYLRLIETAPHNYGKNKAYEGVVGNLVAYALKCRLI